jgi:hypothetical protein
MSFLAGSPAQVDLAIALLRRWRLLPLDAENKLVHAFSHVLAAQLLCHYGDRLPVDIADDLRACLERRILRDRCYQSSYNGYNDNYPSMDACAVLLASRVLDLPAEAVAGGLNILRDLRRLHHRRGFISEYTSPTYSPITTQCLAEIVTWSPLAEARELAAAAERRLWLEMASHWHPQTSSLAGPHSRAYLVDQVGHPHNIHTLFYQVFGEAVLFNPTNHLFPYFDDLQVRHQGGNDEAFRAHAAWFLLPEYHVPPEAVELAWSKPCPSTVIATAEYGAFPRNWGGHGPHPEHPKDVFPAGHTVCTTYLTDDFALGTSRREFLQGAPDTNVHLVFRRRNPVCSIADTATLFPALLVNGYEPNRFNRLNNRGRAVTLQKEGAVLSLQHVRPPWGAPPDADDTGGITSIDLSLLLTCFHAQPQELRFGTRTLAGLEGESAEQVPVFLRDGPIYLVLHPLLLTNHGRPIALRSRRVNGYLQLSLISYEGPVRVFSEYELLATNTGFVMEAARAADWPDGFDAFCAFHVASEIEDTYRNGADNRQTTYRRKGMELAIGMSVVQEGIRFATINGKLASEDSFSVNGTVMG